MAYGVGNKGSNDAIAETRKVLLFDLGGGTLDVSVLAVERHGYLSRR
jgi:molecular chaperone DnaK (HSP70)